MEIISKISALETSDTAIWLNEASFGFQHIKPYCESLDVNSNILEIGCGSGILLAMLSSTFKQSSFEGIEPFGDGFSSLTRLNNLIQEEGVNITNIGFETFSPKKKYDLIYCVNVFEHVDSWRDFILTVCSWLKPDAKLVILCPNYGFPYESHFKIPIFFSKKITGTVFRNYIGNFEEKHDYIGLWNSLNFVKKKSVVNFVDMQPSISVRDDLSIVEQMVDRIVEDKEFRKRQKVIGTIAQGLNKTGAIKMLMLFPNFLPYMKLEIIQSS